MLKKKNSLYVHTYTDEVQKPLIPDTAINIPSFVHPFLVVFLIQGHEEHGVSPRGRPGHGAIPVTGCNLSHTQSHGRGVNPTPDTGGVKQTLIVFTHCISFRCEKDRM